MMQFMTHEGLTLRAPKEFRRNFTDEVLTVQQGFLFDPTTVNTRSTAMAWASSSTYETRVSELRFYRAIGQTDRSESHAQVWYVLDQSNDTYFDLREEEFHWLFFNGLINNDGSITRGMRWAKNGSQYRLIPEGSPEYVKCMAQPIVDTCLSEGEKSISVRYIQFGKTYKDASGALYRIKRVQVTYPDHKFYRGFHTLVQVQQVLLYQRVRKPVYEVYSWDHPYAPPTLANRSRKEGLTLSDTELTDTSFFEPQLIPIFWDTRYYKPEDYPPAPTVIFLED